MTIRLEDEVKDCLDQLAEATRRSKSFLAAEAIRAFVETNEWQIREIRAALREADAEDFASDKDVAALSRKKTRYIVPYRVRGETVEIPRWA